MQWSFGCRHANTSFPQTVPSRRRHPNVATSDGHRNVGAGGGLRNVGAGGDRRDLGAQAPSPASHGVSNAAEGGCAPSNAAVAKVTYVTCLNCGREFNYCWRTMQRLSSAPTWAPTWIEEQMTGTCSSHALREIEELRHLWMT